MRKPVLSHLSEPKLTFGYNQKMADPRDGITLFGPYTRNKIAGQINIGIIGPDEQRKFLKEYLKEIHKPIFGDGQEKEIARPYFPGLEASFGIFINFENLREIDVPREEIDNFLKYTDGHQRVYNLSNLYANKLYKYDIQEEVPVTVWFVVIPDDIYRYGRPKSRIPSSEENINNGLSKKERRSRTKFLFDYLNQLKKAYDFKVNFHNQLKAKLLSQKIVTQIVKESTIAYKNIFSSPKEIEYEQKFDTAKSWNISTTLYYKAGGIPWRLGDVRGNVCYLGLVFKKLDFDDDSQNACCAAQMFLDSGDGMVFRGNIGPWYNPKTNEYHLKKPDAVDLLSKSLESFKARSSVNKYAEEIFIHARTHFNDDEWEGFREVAEGKSKIIGVRIRDDRVFKLYRDYAYCVPRGTVLRIDERKAYLWSKGYIPRLQTQLGLETPNPLSVEITRGDSNIMPVCRDILALTKLNYNACIFADGLPVTLRFAGSIGEILTSGKNIEGEVLQFKYYI